MNCNTKEHQNYLKKVAFLTIPQKEAHRKKRASIKLKCSYFLLSHSKIDTSELTNAHQLLYFRFFKGLIYIVAFSATKRKIFRNFVKRIRKSSWICYVGNRYNFAKRSANLSKNLTSAKNRVFVSVTIKDECRENLKNKKKLNESLFWTCYL